MSTSKLFTVLFTALLLSLALVSAGTISQPLTSTIESISIPNPVVSTISSITLENAQTVTPTASISSDNLTLTVRTPTINYANVILGKIYSGSILLVNASTNTVNQTIPVTITKTYCSNGTVGNGTTRYVEITSVRDTSSSTDWKWKPADSVDIAVKVKYHNELDNSDTIDAIIKVELYDTQKNTFVDFDNSDSADLERSVSLDEGKTVTEDFIVDIPVSDLEDSSGRYQLYVKVYEDGSENKICADNWNSQYSQSISISKNSYDVILKDTALTSDTVPCGQEAIINTKAINTGNSDEDKVYVTAYNQELGINLNSSVFTLNQGDSNKLSFSFMVPNTASESTHVIYLTTHYRYSTSSKEYRAESDAYTLDLKVDGCIPPVTASVTAQLNSETPKAVIGGQVIVDATVTNTGTASAAYTLDVTGNTAWSTLAQIDPKTFTLGAGESKKVSIYLNVDSNAAAGDQTFTIKTTSGTYSADKTVQLTLEKGFTSSAIIKNLQQYWYFYALGLIILILVIAIIVAIVSLSKK